jgi:hypothetical protein
VASSSYAALALAVLLPLGAAAQMRLDHRGSVGLLIGSGLEVQEAVSGTVREGGTRALLDLGGTIAVGHEGNELMALARAGFGGPSINWTAIGGYRGYFGVDAWKTFFDLGIAAHFTRAFTLGPRVGFGVQYELGSLAGAYVGGAAQLSGGNGFRFSGELIAGFQFRSYLLE